MHIRMLPVVPFLPECFEFLEIVLCHSRCLSFSNSVSILALRVVNSLLRSPRSSHPLKV